MHIYNGATAKEKIDQLLSQNPLSHRQHIFVLLDLDNFKLINKTFGIAISPKDGNNFSELSKKALPYTKLNVTQKKDIKFMTHPMNGCIIFIPYN